jgi:hypothetical protein
MPARREEDGRWSAGNRRSSGLWQALIGGGNRHSRRRVLGPVPGRRIPLLVGTGAPFVGTLSLRPRTASSLPVITF